MAELKNLSRIFLFVLFASNYVTADAAVPVLPPRLDSGAVQTQKQQVEKYNMKQPGIKQDSKPVISGPERKEPATLTTDSGIRFILEKVTFSPSMFLSKQELDAIVQPFLKHKIGMQDVQRIVGKVNELYKARGIVTALAVLPPQKIVSGELHINLVEGKLGKAKVATSYTDPAFLLSQLPLRKGEIVNVPRLEHDLIWFNRTHDIQLHASVKPGKEFGMTDFDIQATEPKRRVVKVFADNQNVPSFGRAEAGVDVRLNGLLKRDDFLSMLVSTSQGITNGYGAFGIPFNNTGGQITASYSTNHLSIIDGPYAGLNITGVSHRRAISISQPFYVDRAWLLSSAFTYANSSSTNYISNVLLSNFDIDTYSAGLSVDRQGAGYKWDGQLTLDYGRATDQFNSKSDYSIYSGSFSGIWSIVKNIYGVVRTGGQYTGANSPPPSALFQLGGPGTVRGYDTGVVTGNYGFYVNTELHESLAQGWDAFIFADHGRAYTPNVPDTQISGVGAGLSWVRKNVTANLVYGQPGNVVRPDQPNQQINVRVEMVF